MRNIGKHRNLKALQSCRGYFHDGSKVYDRVGREIPIIDGKAKVLVDFKWVEIDLSNSKSKPKAKSPSKKSEVK